MKKNLLFRLCLMMIALLSLYSCIHDEVYSSSDPSSTEYTNKSLWKQDEKYIKNVMKVYAENEAEIKKVNGIPYWNFATTVDSFDESFVAIPVVNEGKVISVLKVPRHGKNIYFYYTHDESDLKFFQGLVFARHKKEGMADGSTAQTDGIACTRKWMSIWLPDSESNPDPDSGAGHWSTVSIIKCEATKDECIGIALPNGDCDLSGGNEGGYEYPGGGGEGTEPEEEEDPCDKLKTKLTGMQFKEKFQSLKNPANFALNHEVGFFEKDGQFFPTSSEPCSNFVKANTSLNCLKGIMHTHQNFDCEGTFLEPVPSPEDVDIFIRIPLAQAGQCSGNYQDAYHLTIASGGTYMLNYNGSTPPSNNYNVQVWSDWYESEYKNLFDKKQYTQNNIEELFTKFLSTCIGIDGLEVYKIENDTATKLEYNQSTGTTSSTPCPN